MKWVVGRRAAHWRIAIRASPGTRLLRKRVAVFHQGRGPVFLLHCAPILVDEKRLRGATGVYVRLNSAEGESAMKVTSGSLRACTAVPIASPHHCSFIAYTYTINKWKLGRLIGPVYADMPRSSSRMDSHGSYLL